MFIQRSFETPVTILPVEKPTSNFTLSIGLLLRCITIRIPTTALNSVRINPSFDTGLTFQAPDQTEGSTIYGTSQSIRIRTVHCGKHCRNTLRYMASLFDRKATEKRIIHVTHRTIALSLPHIGAPRSHYQHVSLEAHSLTGRYVFARLELWNSIFW
jgi:hypothetical protein